ncbi:uncharacterized protein RHOBADRAFT_56000 [Rhodotorula graminis WP1]|uniref:F-box domain-containing protein n=1 Tax=Rhodotorula graminis (strain WP1) TaxID=578459 RepID=A0A0P9GGZ2_RHOGW|nr:uncharacterized protein RHOBADRAFT_56000 [Rhodotorula graminis WP1]KPV72169.1 hypothetical protein RHOBADRAFT_56000 [Rhodotorula graminis WP1]
MFDRLPYELLRRILDETHPPLAASSFDSPHAATLRPRLAFLGSVERVSKVVQVVAHELLWHALWIRPVMASFMDLDRILDPACDGRDLVRVLNYERHDKSQAAIRVPVELATVMQALSQMHKVVEISLRQPYPGGKLLFPELLKRQCLRSLIIEGDHLELLVAPQFLDSLAMPMLRHLALEGIVLSSRVIGILFKSRHFPVLETVSIQRIIVNGMSAFPEIEPELLQQLKSINVALDEWHLCQPVLDVKVKRVLVHVDGRISRNMERNAQRDGIPWSPSSVHLGVQNLVLMTEESVLYDGAVPELLARVARLASLLVQSGYVTTIFRAVTLRNNVPRAPVGSRAAEQQWRSLRSECYSHKVGIYYLDDAADFEFWPAWAQANPSLRRMVAVTQERDLRREEKARRGRTGRA